MIKKTIFTNKAISPIISMFLILVVVVISIVSFTIWFNDYNSRVYADVETQIKPDSQPAKIDSFRGNVLYIVNPSKNITIVGISIDGYNCGISNLVSTDSLVSIIIPDFCIGNSSIKTPNLVVYTDKQIIDSIINLDR